jgi:hypothetical protein
MENMALATIIAGTVGVIAFWTGIIWLARKWWKSRQT